MRKVVIRPKKVFVSGQHGGILPGASRVYQPFRNRDKGYNILKDPRVKKFKNISILDSKGQLTDQGRQFMKDYHIKLTDKPKILVIPSNDKETDINETDYLDYLTALEHPKIANSESEITPSSDYYMEDLEKQDEVFVAEFDYKLEAFNIITNLDNSRRVQLLTLLAIKSEGGAPYYDIASLAENSVKTRLVQFAEEDPKDFCDMYNSEDRDTKFLIGDLITYDIWTCTRGVYKYNGNQIGINQEAAVTYLDDPKNRETREVLAEEVAKRKKRK